MTLLNPSFSEQRRRFSRVLFNADARLSGPDRGIECEVCDLSLKGALVKIGSAAAFPVGTNVELELNLDLDGEATIRMSGTVAHHDGSLVGVRCIQIDLDSITHLRRLVELNIGDETMLKREISALSIV